MRRHDREITDIGEIENMISPKMAEAVAVIRIDVESFTAKARRI